LIAERFLPGYNEHAQAGGALRLAAAHGTGEASSATGSPWQLTLALPLLGSRRLISPAPPGARIEAIGPKSHIDAPPAVVVFT
jgi:hypothetical protein